MKIAVSAFAAARPKIAEHLIANNASTEAINCDLRRGLLEAMKTIANAANLSNSAAVTVYDMGAAYISFNGDVDIVDSFVYDTNGRIYYTGDGIPKQTDASLALSGGDPAAYPGDYYKLGLPKPSTPLTISLQGTPAADADISHTTAYTYTYVTGWGEESEPADATAAIDVYVGHDVWLSNFATTDTTDLNITHFRIYRVANGNLNAEFQFVADVGYQASQSYHDQVSDSDLGEVLPTEGWTAPPTDLQGLRQFANGILIGFRDNELYLSKPFIPYAFPEEYIQKINHTIVGLGSYGNATIVLTDELPYIASGTDPESVIIYPMQFNQGCVSKKSIVDSPMGVVFASPDGLCLATDGTVTKITEGFLTKEQWQAYDISNLIGFYHEQRYYGFFSGSNEGIIIDQSGVVEFTISGITAVYGGYVDTASDTIKLVCDVDGTRKIVDFNSGTTPLSYTWKSKHFIMPDDISFSCGQVLGDFSTYTSTLKIYADETLVKSLYVTGASIFRIPAKRGKTWRFEITGQAPIKTATIATSISEL